MNSNTLIEDLFLTRAFRVSNPEQPFWYTSGKFGPYYINTHFLYGDEDRANELLALIEACTAEPLRMPAIIARAIRTQYEASEIFRSVVALLAKACSDLTFDAVSGGERRDFFFSIPLADHLEKPHVAILKDGRAFWSTPGGHDARQLGEGDLQGYRVLHVADLITEASSYFRSWLPALSRAGAKVDSTLAVVDRDQGGREALRASGVALKALLRIDPSFFNRTREGSDQQFTGRTADAFLP